jgi:hypothetical protein
MKVSQSAWGDTALKVKFKVVSKIHCSEHIFTFTIKRTTFPVIPATGEAEIGRIEV